MAKYTIKKLSVKIPGEYPYVVLENGKPIHSFRTLRAAKYYQGAMENRFGHGVRLDPAQLYAAELVRRATR